MTPLDLFDGVVLLVKKPLIISILNNAHQQGSVSNCTCFLQSLILCKECHHYEVLVCYKACIQIDTLSSKLIGIKFFTRLNKAIMQIRCMVFAMVWNVMCKWIILFSKNIQTPFFAFHKYLKNDQQVVSNLLRKILIKIDLIENSNCCSLKDLNFVL